MKFSTRSRLDQLVSTTALSFSVAVLVCLSFVFVGCTSPSSPSGLHFLKVRHSWKYLKLSTWLSIRQVDLEDFPKLRDLRIRDSFNIDTAPISSGGRNAAKGVVSSIDTSPNEAINVATSAASGTIQAQIHGLKSHLSGYYFVGLWSYCKTQNGSEVVCSDPSTSFSFDLSAVLDSTPIKVSDMLPDLDQSLTSGYRRFAQSVICLYISGFVTTTLTLVLAGRKVFFSKGSRLLAIFCTVCDTRENIEETCW